MNYPTCGDCAMVSRFRTSRLYGMCNDRTVKLVSPACDMFHPRYDIPTETNCEVDAKALFAGCAGRRSNGRRRKAATR